MIEMTKKIPAIILVLLFAIQLYIPISMIMGQEKVIEKGQVHKFRVGLLDPVDPFRGRYVILNIEPSTINVQIEDCNSYKGQLINVSLEVDEDGYSYFDRPINIEDPDSSQSYIEIEVSYAIQPYRQLGVNELNQTDSLKVEEGGGLANDSCILHLNIPFTRYYMEETKAPKAERFMFDRELREDAEIWLEVSVLNGSAVPTGLYVDGDRIEDMVADADFDTN